MVPKPKSSDAFPQPVSRLLGSSSQGLSRLLAQARRFEALNQRLAGLLNSDMQALVQVAAVHDGCLVLLTPSASLATRLRMDSESLLRSMNAAGGESLQQLKVRVAPLPQTKPAPGKRRRALPESARQSLQRFAEDSGDTDLRERLDKK
jgi:hypothetical protein